LAAAVWLCSLLVLGGPGAGMADTASATAAASTTAATTGATATATTGATTTTAATGATGQQLTLQQAISMALANSPSLKAANYSVDQAKQNQSLAAEPVIASSFTAQGSASPEDESAVNNLAQANLNYQQAQKNYQASRDTVVMEVYQDYFGILEDEAALESARQALNLADWNQRATTLNYQLGGASRYQVITANQNYASAQAALASAQATLNAAYQQFDQLVGLMPDDRPVLTDQPSFTPLVIGSLEAEVDRVLNTSPTVSAAQNSVSQAQTALSVYSYDTSKNAATLDSLAIAQQNAVSTENSVAQQVRNLYYNIKTLESKQDSLQQSLDAAQANLEMTQVKYDTGAASAIDLANAKYALAQAQQALLDNSCQHQLSVQAFETPWAGTGGSGS
jgi:hypothetical protein